MGFFLISRVMDRLHKKQYMLTEKAFILECIDTYILIQMTSKVVGPYMLSSFRKHLDTIPTIGASFARPRVQHKSLVYRHISCTVIGVNKPIICKYIDKKSMLYTGCIQRVSHGMYTIKFYLCICVIIFIQMTSKVILFIVLYNDMPVLFATCRTDMVLRVLTIIYLHTV